MRILLCKNDKVQDDSGLCHDCKYWHKQCRNKVLQNFNLLFQYSTFLVPRGNSRDLFLFICLEKFQAHLKSFPSLYSRCSGIRFYFLTTFTKFRQMKIDFNHNYRVHSFGFFHICCGIVVLPEAVVMPNKQPCIGLFFLVLFLVLFL